MFKNHLKLYRPALVCVFNISENVLWIEQVHEKVKECLVASTNKQMTHFKVI